MPQHKVFLLKPEFALWVGALHYIRQTVTGPLVVQLLQAREFLSCHDFLQFFQLDCACASLLGARNDEFGGVQLLFDVVSQAFYMVVVVAGVQPEDLAFFAVFEHLRAHTALFKPIHALSWRDQGLLGVLLFATVGFRFGLFRAEDLFQSCFADFRLALLCPPAIVNFQQHGLDLGMRELSL